MAELHYWILPSTLIAYTHVKPYALKSLSFNNIFQELLMDLSRKLITYLKKKAKAGEIGSSVGKVLRAHEDLASIPRTQMKS